MEETLPYNDEYLVKLYKRSTRYALTIKKARHIVEDFAAYAILRAIGCKKRISLEFVMHDFLREQQLVKRNSYKKGYFYAETYSDLDVIFKLVKAPEYHDPNYINKFVLSCKRLTDNEKYVFIMHVEHEYDQCEIAEKMGIHYTRVNQILRSAKKKLKRRLKFDVY